MYPKEFDNLVEQFEKLPGVGIKTAQRYVFTLLNKEKEDMDRFANCLQDIKNIKRCKTCGFLADEEECALCKDKTRDKSTIMVVGYPQELVAIEKTNTYHGMYHVLNGLISSSKGIYPDDINIQGLLKRIDNNVKEIILAISPTSDGEMTAMYLEKILKENGILVSKLAHGLPTGSSIDYADDLTLVKAIANRTKQ